MADAEPNWHGVLTPAVATVVTLEEGFAEYQVINVDGAHRVDFTTDGTTPVVGGSPTGRVLAQIAGFDDIVNVNSQLDTNVIKLISAGAAVVSVQVIAGPNQG